MDVHLVDLPRLHAPIRGDIDAAIRRVIDSGRFVLGAEVDAFEHEVAAWLGVKHAVGMSSGSDALLACMWADGVGPGDEIVTSAYSFAASAEATQRLGATPVFADIGADLNIDPADVAARVTTRTRGILAVDLFGRRADVARLAALGTMVYEDAAQAIGAGIGEGVRAAALSFFPTKNLGALGDGGLVTTDDDGVAAAVRALRVHGATRKYVHERTGWNMRLDALQAAVLRVKLPHLAAWNEARAAIAARYLEGLEGMGLDLPPVRGANVWHQFVVLADDRDGLRERLRVRGVETEIYYPTPLHRFECFGHAGPSLPAAERAARRALALPIHPSLHRDEVDWVIESVRASIDTPT